jgi:hypothetical protein
VHVAPVGGHGLAGGLVPEELAEQGLLAYPRRADGEQVVAVAAHPDSEAQGLDGAFLANDALEGRSLGGGGEGDVVEAAGTLEEIRRKPRRSAHPRIICGPLSPFGAHLG